MAVEDEVADVAVARCGDDVIVHLSGELDMESIVGLTASLTPLLSDGPFRTVRVNAARLTFCDSSGLAFVLGLPHVAQAERVVIEEPSRAVRAVLDVVGLSTYLLADEHSPAPADEHEASATAS